MGDKEIRFLLVTGSACNFCADKDPHSHPMCPDCGTVGFRNTIGCATCREAMAKKKTPPLEAPVNN